MNPWSNGVLNGTMGLGLMAIATLAAVPPAAAQVVEADGIRAEYSAQDDGRCHSTPRLRIVRQGQVALNSFLTTNVGFCQLVSEGFAIRDLDGDGEPEVLLSVYSGGAHCCWFSQIFRYDPSTQRYVGVEHNWGNVGPAALEDLDADGRPEFISADDRFAYEFASFAGSAFPPQFWRYEEGQLVDVTRQHPTQVDEAATRLWDQYTEAQQSQQEVKGALAAYLATKYLLDQGDDGWEQVEQHYQGRDRALFLSDLRRFLQATGYAPKPPAEPVTPALGTTVVLLQVEGNLEPGDLILPTDNSLYDEHPFEGQAGQPVVITLESDDFDPYLVLVGPDSDLVSQNDDISPGNRNSSLTSILPTTGQYLAIANAYDATGRGRYTLTVRAIVRSVQTLENLPDGTYLFAGLPLENPNATPSGRIEVVLQKSGTTATGVILTFMAENSCFQGTVEGDGIQTVTYADPPYGDGTEAWSFYPGQPLDLGAYEQRLLPDDEHYTTLLQSCLGAY